MSAINANPLRDPQMIPFVDACARCGSSLHWESGEICDKCKEELEDERTDGT